MVLFFRMAHILLIEEPARPRIVDFAVILASFSASCRHRQSQVLDCLQKFPIPVPIQLQEL